MWYINATPNEAGYYGTPVSNPFPGCVALSDALLSAYIEAMGFVHLVVEEDEVVVVEVNLDALETYLAEHPAEQITTETAAPMTLEEAVERGMIV